MTTPKAQAFLALWNGISGPRVQPEYEAWHTFEHVPERVGLPGFIQARRYRSLAQPLRYYTWYALTSRDALATPEYRDVFTHPTPWSARIRTQMRDFFRMPCELGGAHGNSSAARLATVRLQAQGSEPGAQLDARLRQMVREARLVSAQWGTAHPASDFPLANAAALSSAAGPELVLMLQHLDLEALRAGTQALLLMLAPLATPSSPPEYFEFLTQVRQDELAHPLTTRQPQRTELLQTFIQGDTA